MNNVDVAFLVGGVFALLASVVSLWSVYETIQYNSNPELKRYITRILLLVPIYSLESWLGLRFNDAAIYLDVAREVYEALVIYSFYQFLVFFLGGEEYLQVVFQRKPPQHHTMGFQYCLKTWVMGPKFLWNTKVGTLQYVVFKPLLAMITFVTQATGTYDEGNFHATVAYPYVAFFTNCSQLWALYCLVLFYFATAEDLHSIRPVLKFMCVKLIVFFTWWQGVGIAILVSMGLIPQVESYSADNVGKGIQEFIVCIEMLGFAIAHVFAFPPKEFHDPERHAQGPVFHSLLAITNPLDIVRDVRDVVQRSELLDRRPRDPALSNELVSPTVAPNASGPFMLGARQMLPVDRLLQGDMQTSDYSSTDGI